ncbi:MAG: hypothetical protein ACTS73_02240 [Arsenophonus sp. NEOnobi-MAG3]
MPLIKPCYFISKVFSEASPAAMKKLEKDQEELLVFYDLPSEH